MKAAPSRAIAAMHIQDATPMGDKCSFGTEIGLVIAFALLATLAEVAADLYSRHDVTQRIVNAVAPSGVTSHRTHKQQPPAQRPDGAGARQPSNVTAAVPIGVTPHVAPAPAVQ